MSTHEVHVPSKNGDEIDDEISRNVRVKSTKGVVLNLVLKSRKIVFDGVADEESPSLKDNNGVQLMRPPRTRRERKRYLRNLSSKPEKNEGDRRNTTVGLTYGSPFLPEDSEFTILFFGSHFTCRHTLQSIHLVEKFIERANVDCRMHRDVCQIVYIDESVPYQMHSFSQGRWFFLPSSSPDSRSDVEMLRLVLCVHITPCVIVVNNSNGRVVTDLGIQCIDSYSDSPHTIIEAWRQGNSGLSSFQIISLYCTLS